MGVSGQLHVPVDLPVEENLPVSVEKVLVGLTAVLYVFDYGKPSCLRRESSFDSLVVQPVA
jgi:hypothetical protein